MLGQEPGLSPTIVPLPALGGAVASLVIGALFAGADTAVTSLSATRLEALIDQARGANKQAYLRIQQQDAKLRSRYLLGRIASTAVTAICLLEVFEPYLSPGLAGWVALGVTVLVTSAVFEVTTTLARKHADSAAVWAARWMRPLEIVLLPLAIPLGWLGSRVWTRGGEHPAHPGVTEAEVEALVDEGERSGVFAGEPAEMIRNLLDFAERTAKDAMIPRNEVEAIPVTTPIDEVLRLVAESGHSRYPVYRDQIDNVVGLLYAKDLYKSVHPTEDGVPRVAVKKLDELVRTPANFVAESQPLATLLREMRARRQHLAIVVDEIGRVSGIVTLEDVLEEIVGEIHDEHDTEGTIEDLGEGHVVADATISLKELFAYLGADLPKGADESLGKMLTHHLGKIPEAGTAFSKFGLRFIVRTMEDQHVGKVEVIRG
jgi:CBS domain containing-hemolysin-like protein